MNDKIIHLEIDQAAQKTVDYLYKIDGEITTEQYQTIDRLRQLINEVFVANKQQISSQVIYDVLKEVL